MVVFRTADSGDVSRLAVVPHVAGDEGAFYLSSFAVADLARIWLFNLFAVPVDLPIALAF